MQCDIGLIGLAVMGQNLVLNMAKNGYKVAVYNRSASRTDEFMKNSASEAAASGDIVAEYDLKGLVAQLKKPRRVMLMVQAGAPVDAVLAELTPLLSEGDIVIDGGNTYYKDTQRRIAMMHEKGLLYLGTGVSGGEEGALNGPSIMPGGDKEAYEYTASILKDISAWVADDGKITSRGDGQPCCAYIGPDGAGHFVKMTHNGIEYGDMQLICEVYDILRKGLNYTAEQCADVFEKWNSGELDSYLIDITADILRVKDDVTGKPIVDVVLDRAGQKGTGTWTAQEALAAAVPAPTIAEAVYARGLSALKTERVAASKTIESKDEAALLEVKDDISVKPGQTFDEALVETLERALYAAKICAYAQGFALLKEAASANNWPLNYGEIAMLWRGGCIIRARFLSRIKEAFDRDGELCNLMADQYFADILKKTRDDLRAAVVAAVKLGIPVPCLSSAMAYYDGYHCADLPANLLQAQRDYFGAHTYERTDKPGAFHTKWL